MHTISNSRARGTLGLRMGVDDDFGVGDRRSSMVVCRSGRGVIHKQAELAGYECEASWLS